MIRRVLYLHLQFDVRSGGGAFTSQVGECLRRQPRVEIVTYGFDPAVPVRDKLMGLLQGYTMGMTSAVSREVISLCRSGAVEVVFAASTHFGKILAEVKRELPGIKVISLLQNVEIELLRDVIRLGSDSRLKKLVGYASVYYNEKRQLALSDFVIALNNHDSDTLRERYGRAADLILPITVEDRFVGATSVAGETYGEYALFVGSCFAPNVYGVQWLAEKIAPRSPIRIVVVGKGMEALAGRYAEVPNLEIIGSVEDLGPWYYGARFVVAPIFHGSGMKVKTAEAMMYGKRIVATAIALEGYDCRLDAAVSECNTAEEFLAAMSANATCRRFEPEIRERYLKRHSPAAMMARLGEALEAVS